MTNKQSIPLDAITMSKKRGIVPMQSTPKMIAAGQSFLAANKHQINQDILGQLFTIMAKAAPEPNLGGDLTNALAFYTGRSVEEIQDSEHLKTLKQVVISALDHQISVITQH